MAYMNFVEALMEAKRRAQLQGRPISEQETRGITEGFAKTAGELNLAEKAQETQKEQFGQTLTQRKYETERQMQAAEEARKEEGKQRAITTTTTGAVLGGAAGYYAGPALSTYLTGAGTAISPGLGTAIGAGAGLLLGYAGSKLCIIISSCTSPDSHEVQIAREYRDKFMDEGSLTGYYVICHYLVPVMDRSPWVKKLIKKALVNRLVDYGEWKLGYKPIRRYRTSIFITHSFLWVCSVLGIMTQRLLEREGG